VQGLPEAVFDPDRNGAWAVQGAVAEVGDSDLPGDCQPERHLLDEAESGYHGRVEDRVVHAA